MKKLLTIAIISCSLIAQADTKQTTPDSLKWQQNTTRVSILDKCYRNDDEEHCFKQAILRVPTESSKAQHKAKLVLGTMLYNPTFVISEDKVTKKVTTQSAWLDRDTCRIEEVTKRDDQGNTKKVTEIRVPLDNPEAIQEALAFLQR